VQDAGLTKVSSRMTVQDSVYEQLRHALMWGMFEPDQVVTIAALSAQFGTSHMPVREALRRLAAENGLEIARNGSARVPPVSRARLDDLCLARIALESLATERATPRMQAADIARIHALAEEHEALGRSGNVYDMLRKNQEFHFAIYDLSGSDVLPQLIEMLWLRFGPYMRMLSNLVASQLAEKSASYSGYHYRILNAISLMVKDIETTQTMLQALC
jgi:DNA-binding GntR family transcriptional regulator